MNLDDIRTKMKPYLGITPEAHRAAMARLEEDVAAVIAEIEEEAILAQWKAMAERFRERFARDPSGMANCQKRSEE